MSPRYREIAAQLASEIEPLAAGTSVAGELDVAERFGVGRGTARAAMEDLQRRALVRRVRGLGTFRSARIDYVVSTSVSPSWSQTVRDGGGSPRTVVRSCQVADLPEDVAQRLQLSPGTPCYRLQRCSFTDDLPAAWGEEWVPVATVPELPTAVRAQESLDRILRDMAGVRPVRGWVRASMDLATADVAAELGVTDGAPAWLVESLNLDGAGGAPVYLSRRWIRADAIRVIFEAG